MRLSVSVGLLACVSVHAFSDSSPFILLSTAKNERPSTVRAAQLQSSSQVLSSAKLLLDLCPTELYLLISQPNAHASDLRCGPGELGCRDKAPQLRNHAASYSVLDVAEVHGSLSFEDFSDHIKARCLAQGKTAQVKEHTLRALPTGKGLDARAAVLAENDEKIGQILGEAQSEGGYTAIYFSNPNDFKPYQPEFADPVHMELKRQSVDSLLLGRKEGDSTRTPGLFQEYQFFTPAIFMSFIAAFIILSILYAGLSALSSLQVSYGAFEKEMGPTAQKKHM